MDSQYVSRTLGLCLSQGLAELIEHRPQDPIESLALWILKYKQNLELQEQKSSQERQLEEEQRRLHAEAVHQKLLQDEETQLQHTQPADESKLSPPDQTDAAQDPGDQTESETVKELEEDQEDSGEAVAGEEQPSETPNTDQSQSQDTQVRSRDRWITIIPFP
ncbi:DPY30 domain containing 2 [Carassius carassius]|uniref:DPY30 domain containing 2 n=1 Tax=Carassius carassius TaxID=217509 RepID=UPI002868D19B|nr:DPY30 domain containing 2 [Carassius carassius]